ncbi:MAG: hypothetical protein M3R17_20450 [Bacteroidota bacterium]|nr:hypothetical protein [Bacteroidota bacterium]
MRFFFFFVFAFLFLISANKSTAISPVENADTCFYSINVPPDIDFPETPHFDTTIERAINCKTQVLKLPGWGSGTGYTLTRNDSIIKVHKAVSFSAAQKSGLIDITDLPAGIYGMSLAACGNGGAFTVRLK